MEKFSRVFLRVMYRSSGGRFSNWPNEIDRWENSLLKRLSSKQYILKKEYPPLFEKGARYAFIDQEKTRRNYIFCGYIEKGESGEKSDQSRWEELDISFAPSGNYVLDIEYCPNVEIKRFGKKSPCDLHDLPSSLLDSFTE